VAVFSLSLVRLSTLIVGPNTDQRPSARYKIIVSSQTDNTSFGARKSWKRFGKAYSD
jgi:hypothetical protein